MKLNLGDVIQFTEYMVGHMNCAGPFRMDEMIGVQAIVVQINMDRGDICHHVRYLTGNKVGGQDWVYLTSYGTYSSYHPGKCFEVIKVGNGEPPVEGVDYVLTEDEYRQRRYIAFTNTLSFEYEGWCNAASYLAHLYLNNERTFHNMLPQLRRKDGTINPDKVKKAFHQLKLKIDDWAYECPRECPEEFKTYINQYLRQFNQIDWHAVTAEFNTK